MLIVFTSEETVRRVDQLLDYLRGPRLWIPSVDYPDFDGWLVRAYTQLKTEAKRALIALSGQAIVGAVLYQRHRLEVDAVEIKNITVRPDQRGRYVASFLLRNAEVEGAADFAARRALVDSKRRNIAMCRHLERNGYQVRSVLDLYGLGAGDDVLFEKPIDAARGRIVS